MPITRPPKWMRGVLLAAAAYNIVWGAAVIIAPGLFFRIAQLDEPLYPDIWRCVGMIVGVYGVGYAIASIDPRRHWPIVLVGLLGKVLGPIGFVMAAASGRLPWTFGWTIIFNDLIWWAPFALILYDASASRRRAMNDEHGPRFPAILETATTNEGETLLSLSNRQPVLLVFLRHLGCTFCREALADVRDRRTSMEEEGVRITLVHMSNDEDAAKVFEKYGLTDLPRVSDPKQEVYRAFGLGRGRLSQLFGPKTWLRGVAAAVKGHGIGRLMGDGLQMPGVFLLDQGQIIRAFRHESAADRPDYEGLACDSGSCPAPGGGSPG